MQRDRSEYCRQYYLENKERLLQKQKRYYQQNREKKIAYFKAYLETPEGKKKRQEYTKKYHKRSDVKERDKQRKQKMKEWYRRYHIEYYHKHKDEINAKRRKNKT